LNTKALLMITIVGLILLNASTFIAAYPETLVVDGGCCSNRPLAKDFSAYYVGAWRLFHDSSAIYAKGAVNDGAPSTPPVPEAFKYTPSFLLLVLPFTYLGYHEALLAFDLFQFALLPVIAVLLWWLLRHRSPLFIGVAMLLILLQPSPLPHWGLSASYYWQWAEGQAKVLEAFLLVLSFWLAKVDRPRLSGVIFSLAAFDPRFALFALPLFLFFNGKRWAVSSLYAVVSLVALNAPLLYPPIGAGFFSMVLSSGVTTPLYYYSFIPLAMIVSLYIAYWPGLASAVRSLAGRKGGVTAAPHPLSSTDS
jgi:hypothetical protein